jgi:hypothetical protein
MIIGACECRNSHFDSLVNELHNVIDTFPDNRASNSSKSIKDAAAKRWLSSYGCTLEPLGVTITGDNLYSRQPLCYVLITEFDFQSLLRTPSLRSS